MKDKYQCVETDKTIDFRLFETCIATSLDCIQNLFDLRA